MHLQLDEAQLLLRQAIERFLERELPFETRRGQRTAEDFLSFWRNLERELGIGCAGLPEVCGGIGGGPEAEMIVAGALGAALAVTLYAPSMVAGANLLHQLGQDELLAELVAGRVLVTVAFEEPGGCIGADAIRSCGTPLADGWSLSGTKLAVEFAAQSDAVLVPARTEEGEHLLFRVNTAVLGKALKQLRLIDDTPAADLHFDGLCLAADALLARGERARTAIEHATGRAIAALCAEAAGVARVLVEDTVAYAKEREQFGVALASFQALQHRMVDMWIALQEIEAASLLATLKPDQPAASSAAKTTVAERLRLIGQEAVQLHGAMGMTEELRVGHYFKRATVLAHKLGTADRHVERYRRELKTA